mgnify:CR=1 FL=1
MIGGKLGLAVRDAYDVIIIGNGIAGFSAAQAVREQSPEKSVLLIGEEDRLPYKRTRLSKSIAVGFEREAFQLQPQEWYAARGIDLLIGCRVTSFATDRHTVTLDDGRVLSWSRLVLATGASPLRLDVGRVALPQVLVLRSAAEAERLIAALREAGTACVIGMGVLGVEVAAEMLALGKQVTLVGDCAQLMPRHLNRPTAALLRAEFEARGAKLIFEDRVVDVARGARGLGVTLRRHNTLAADLCVCCLGVAPNLELAQAAGLRVKRGVLVNERLQTSQPDVYAAGDVAEHPDGRVTGLWHAAEHQGRVAGINAAGGEAVEGGRPFRLKCEVFGRYFFSINKPPDDELSQFEVEESATEGAYRCFYFRDGLLHGVVMADEPDRAKQYEQAVRERWEREAVRAAFLSGV